MPVNFDEIRKQDFFRETFKYRLSELVDELTDSFGAVESLLESPIEKQFLSSFLWVCYRKNHFVQVFKVESNPVAVFPCFKEPKESGPRVDIFPQPRVGEYRPDFIIELSHNLDTRLIVECDGRDFHTSEAQVANDKKRDRFFASKGMTTLRFTGSEIHRDSFQCAEETMECLYAKAVGKKEQVQALAPSSGKYDHTDVI